MEHGVGFTERESRLPTSVDRMKEALMVECLNWCNHGRDFDDSCQFIVVGYMCLANFLPDELAETASLDAASELIRVGDMEGLKANAEAGKAANELRERSMNTLNAEWNDFVKTHRNKYTSGQ